MRSIILFFIILFSLSCNKTNDKTIDFLDEGIEQSNQFIYRKNNVILTLFVAASYENPKFVNPWKNKSESIKNKHDLIETIIYTIISQLELGQATKQKEKELYGEISEYHNLIQKLVLDSTALHVINKQLGEIKQDFLSIEGLNVLFNKVSVSTHYALQYLLDKTKQKQIRVNKIYPIIIPGERYLRQGDYYSAEISTCALDTTLLPIVIVEKDTLKVINGIAKYQSAPNESIGVKMLNGQIEYTRIDGRLLSFPFKISYKVIKK